MRLVSILSFRSRSDPLFASREADPSLAQDVRLLHIYPFHISHARLHRYSGVLKLLDGNGNFFGYVSRTLNDYRVYGTTTSRASALTVTFAYSSRKNVFELSSGGTAPYSFVGGTTYLPRGEIRPGDSNFAYLTSTVHSTFAQPTGQHFSDSSHACSARWCNASAC